MAMVDHGIIIRTQDPWIYVKPRCPHCGYLEESDWNLVPMGIPKMQFSKTTSGYTCRKCWKSFTISAYPG